MKIAFLPRAFLGRSIPALVALACAVPAARAGLRLFGGDSLVEGVIAGSTALIRDDPRRPAVGGDSLVEFGEDNSQ